MNRILVLGACGQIGSELTMELRKRYGNNSVVATGHRTKPSEKLHDSGPFEFADILDRESVERVITKHDVDTIYNMAAILSARGEQNPQLAFRVNVLGLYNMLELGREHNLERIMVPSSIAAFGPGTPKVNTPNETLMRPTTMYGVNKVTGELLGNYYFQKYGLDVRGVRYPGIISSGTLPGGGTTDYAVEIYYEALRKKSYTCYLREDTVLPLMYMPDAIEGIIKLAEADVSKLKRHCDYNINSMSLSVGELAASIKKFIPEFVCEYKPNFRQTIADSWPKSLDDSAAREEWGWQPKYSLEAMTKDMLTKLSRKLNKG
ncbi:MAG TPA: NAD-dependent epimerase/dehydratase family protein [Thermoplasmata archaeon]|nr:NAD-dependent epimerase/dehydratase family protein [Thermoplasmata archaeon]